MSAAVPAVIGVAVRHTLHLTLIFNLKSTLRNLQKFLWKYDKKRSRKRRSQVFILFVSWILSKSIYIVHQAEGVVLERLGKFHRVLNSGLNFGVPFFDSPRSFTWRKTYIDANKKIKDESLTCFRIDLRENVFNFTRQEVYTKDTILLDVNSLMFYRILFILSYSIYSHLFTMCLF